MDTRSQQLDTRMHARSVSRVVDWLDAPRLPWVVLALVFARVAWITLDEGTFRDDDFLGGHIALNHSLTESLLVPIDLHVVPLYRLVVGVLWRVAFSRYEVFALTLLAMHAAGLYVLYRLLRGWLDAHSSAWLLCLYAANAYVIVPLLWFSSGMHRFPFLLASLTSLLCYRNYRHSGRVAPLLGATLGCLAATLSYGKGPLSLLTLVGLELCLVEPATRRAGDQIVGPLRRWGGLVVVAVPTVAATVFLRDYQAAHSAGLHFDSGTLFAVERLCMNMLVHLPFAAPTHPQVSSAWIVLPVVALLVVSGLANRRVARIWLVFIGVLAANLAVLAISHRGASFGAAVCGIPRYRFELLHLVFLAVALALREVGDASPRMRLARPRARLLLASAVLVLTVQHALSMPALARGVERRGREYVDHLKSGLAQAVEERGGSISLRDANTPRRAMGPTFTQLPRLSDWVFLLGYPVRFGAAHPDYRVDVDGRLVPLRPQRRAPVGRAADAGKKTGAAAQPDVIVVMIDTLRTDYLSLNGYPRRTSPELEAFAATATHYQRAYAQAPWTAPSVASFLTSRYPRELGIRQEAVHLAPGTRTLARVLKEHGYRTEAVFTNRFVSSRYGFDAGFDRASQRHLADHSSVTSHAVTDRALERMREVDPATPVFLYAHYYDPHFDYRMHFGFDLGAREFGPASLGHIASIVGLRVKAFDDYDTLAARQRYDSEIAFTDFHIGRLFSGLRALGRFDDAVVVVVADHGEAFLEHGHVGHTQSLYDELVHVPLLIKAPAQTSARLEARPVALLDVAPTILQLAGLPPESSHRGVAFKPGSRARSIFTTTYRPDFQTALIQGRFKLIVNHDRHTVEMFDLEVDPYEQHRIEDERPAVEGLLRHRLDAWNDGPFKAAAGVEVRLSEREREIMRALGYGH